MFAGATRSTRDLRRGGGELVLGTGQLAMLRQVGLEHVVSSLCQRLG